MGLRRPDIVVGKDGLYLVWRFLKTVLATLTVNKLKDLKGKHLFQIFFLLIWRKIYFFFKNHWQIENIVYNKKHKENLFKKNYKRSLYEKKELPWFFGTFAPSSWAYWPDPAGQASVWSRSCHRFWLRRGSWRRSGLTLQNASVIREASKWWADPSLC